ncbi:partner and localizer of BRCA2 isoform X2 [Hippocampus comes]|uniref:Partner and localizer of BRCA2 n=1 Tax=Hippocampus comes TaxID=109280 RepID=A0A3Q2XVJ8_HIPCM|nr:PREDICTED: partner and localizer of BRCA2 isoform X2 [Hippocampus comes]
MQSGPFGDVLHCEEQLRSTLYCDDKDNLRRKLAQLQREYLKTAQKLQRAEQMEAVRKHVSNEVAPKQDHHSCRQDRAGPDGTSKPTDGANKSSFGTDDKAVHVFANIKDNLAGTSPADSTIGTIGTPLASTLELEPNCSDPARLSRAGPTLRLRSRHSRMRRQRRGEEAGKSQGEAGSADESQSSGPASPSLPLLCRNIPPLRDEKLDGNAPDDGRRRENDPVGPAGGHLVLEEESPEHSTSLCSVETTRAGEGTSLLESCTPAEGLLYPAEYYVRTTRRMALSQSQPDLRAVVIRGQLSSGRPRRKKTSPLGSSERSAPVSVGDRRRGAVSPPRVSCPARGRKSRRRGGGGNLGVRRASPSTAPALREAHSPNSQPPRHPPQATPPDAQPLSGAPDLFPIFRKMIKSAPVAPSSESWRSLLLPSPKLSPTPPLGPRTRLAGRLSHFDLHRDFHLPDEQFAALKLSKLRQVAAESRMEVFPSPRHNTGGVRRRSGTAAESLGLPLGLTPSVGKLSSPSEDNDPRNIDTRLAPTLPLDPNNLCPSPAEQEPKGLDRQRELLPGCDRPLEAGQEDNGLRDVFPEAIKNGLGAESPPPRSPAVASAPLRATSAAATSSPALPSLGLTPLATSPADTATPSLSLPSPPTASPRPSDPADGQMPPAAEQRASCTLKAPAGSALVDACCLRDSDGRLCVAAAAEWAVSLWSRPSPSGAWTRRHTWHFTEPLMKVFPVPDGAGLVCATLGRPEIKKVRVLSCRGGRPVLLLDGDVRAAVGVAEARVVTSSHSAIGCTLRAFTLAKDGSASHRLHLASPDVCVRALAPVDVLPDALIGTDERGRLFVWNLKSGHLLRKIELGDSLSHTSCLRGFSCRGVLLVLVQHLFLGRLQTKQNVANDEVFCKQKEEKKPALFSLVAVNPLSGKSILAAQLEPPASWLGRLCEADASDVAAVGVNQSGCVCVWQLKRRCGGITVAAAPDGMGWQLARWAEDGATLVTGHHDGNVTLHFDLAVPDHFM